MTTEDVKLRIRLKVIFIVDSYSETKEDSCLIHIADSMITTVHYVQSRNLNVIKYKIHLTGFQSIS